MANKTVTKRDLARAVAEKNSIDRNEALAIMKTLFNQITEELAAGKRIELRDFGVFAPRIKKGRKARNPITGETVYTQDGVAVRFKTGKKMGDEVQRCLHQL